VLSERIERALPWWRRVWMRALYAWRHHRADLVLNLVLPLALVGISAAILGLNDTLRRQIVTIFEPGAGPLETLARVVLPLGSLCLLGWAVGWRITEAVKPLSERMLAYATRPDFRAEMGYQHRVIEEIRFLLRQLHRARPGCRVLVHVDDLDRCSDEKVVELLRATNLVLAACDVFVLLAVDDAMLRRAILARYRGTEAAADPLFADNYLRKIVQVSIFLPETAAEARAQMVSQFFSAATREKWESERGAHQGSAAAGGGKGGDDGDGLEYDLGTVQPIRRVADVTDTTDELAAMHDCREYLPDNARELKRLVNTHRFIKILLSSGGTWPAERQRALVKWLVFCANWPELVDDVLHAAAGPVQPDDCLEGLGLADPKQNERLDRFRQLPPPLSAADLRGDFAVAARLSQVVYDSVAPSPSP
jgi:hypothetical protein